MGLNPARAAIPTQSFVPEMPLPAPPIVPADSARSAYPEALGRLAARHAAIDSGKNPFAKIHRQCSGHACRPPSPQHAA